MDHVVGQHPAGDLGHGVDPLLGGDLAGDEDVAGHDVDLEAEVGHPGIGGQRLPQPLAGVVLGLS